MNSYARKPNQDKRKNLFRRGDTAGNFNTRANIDYVFYGAGYEEGPNALKNQPGYKIAKSGVVIERPKTGKANSSRLYNPQAEGVKKLVSRETQIEAASKIVDSYLFNKDGSETELLKNIAERIRKTPGCLILAPSISNADVVELLDDGKNGQENTKTGNAKSESAGIDSENIEDKGRNLLALYFAHAIATHLGVKVCTNIFQIKRNKRKKSLRGIERFSEDTLFNGNVIPDQNYFLVDDVFTLGGTLSSLKAYIENNGGRVAGLAVMADGARSDKRNKEIHKIALAKFNGDFGTAERCLRGKIPFKAEQREWKKLTYELTQAKTTLEKLCGNRHVRKRELTSREVSFLLHNIRERTDTKMRREVLPLDQNTCYKAGKGVGGGNP